MESQPTQALGQGPTMAKIKGTYFLNTVKALRAGGDRVRRVLAPELHHYLDERILTSTWYPEEDHLELLRAMARLFPAPDGDTWVYYGRVAAERDMVTIYKALLRVGDPGGSFERLAKVWTLGHDSGRLEASLSGEGSGNIELSGQGLLAEELCALHGSFFATVIRLAGGREVEVQHPRCQTRGDDRCRWEFVWE